jgi:hypothetical protein
MKQCEIFKEYQNVYQLFSGTLNLKNQRADIIIRNHYCPLKPLMDHYK